MSTNPINWIGDRPQQGYACIPNELARDGELSSVARSVALYLWSHENGWKSSQAAITKTLGIDRESVRAALRELSESRWLAIFKVSDKRHAYYAHPARKLTEAEHAALALHGGNPAIANRVHDGNPAIAMTEIPPYNMAEIPPSGMAEIPPSKKTNKNTNKKTNEEHGSYVSNAGASAQDSPSAADEKELVDCSALMDECAAMFRTPLKSGLGAGECSGFDGDEQFVYESDLYDQDDWSAYEDQD